jgi:hypothetical protein
MPIPRRHVIAGVIAVLLALPAPARAQQPVAHDRPAADPAAAQANPDIYRAALAHRGMRIMVSTNERRLLLVSRRDTLMDVSVAVGMGTGFEFEGRRYHFETPTGRRTVLAKERDPVWTPPDWHYKERALQLGLELVRLEPDARVELADGSFIVVQDGQVGRLNQYEQLLAVHRPASRSSSTAASTCRRSARRSAASRTRSARTSWTWATAT